MKYLLFIISVFLSTPFFAQENLIRNPNFEQGILPESFGDLHHATHWDHGCGDDSTYGSSDLYDSELEDGGALCRFDVPSNKFFLNLSGKIGNRYAGFVAGTSELDEGPNDYSESLLGTLDYPLYGNCQYNFKMHIANAQRSFIGGGTTTGNCDWNYNWINHPPNRTIDIMLRKDGNCDAGITVLTFDLNSSNSWTVYEGSFTLSQTDLAQGYDRIEIRRGAISERIKVVCDAVSLTIDESSADLDPSFTGPTQFCAGDDMTFVGDDGDGIAQFTFWEIQETNQYGVPVSGGYNWYDWIPGAPGTFTFPENVNPPCNRYYWVKMAVKNACTPWEETLQIIHIGCNPKIPKGTKVSACRGECITLADGFPQYPGITYQWFSSSAEIENGNQLPLEVCPTAPESYWLVATNIATGCASTTFFVVNIESLDPSWSHYENTTVSPYFYNISAVANDTDTESIPGFGYSWKVEKLTSGLGLICEMDNPVCWSVHPLPTDFRGYNGGCIVNCSSSAAGKFYYNRYYRITRTIWSDACGRQRQVKIFYSEDPRSSGEAPRVIVYEGDVSLEALKQLAIENKENKANDISIFPNPSNGKVFHVNVVPADFESSTLDLQVTTLTGQLVVEEKVDRASMLTINLTTGLSNGIYLMRLSDGNHVVTKRMIVQQ